MKDYVLSGIYTAKNENHYDMEIGSNLYLSSVKSSLYIQAKKYMSEGCNYEYFYIETWSKGELIYSECFNFVGDKLIKSNDPDELKEKVYLEDSNKHTKKVPIQIKRWQKI